jgi:ABC-2 type transport system ATP-binding protein
VTAALRFSDVRKRFGAIEALRGLSLEVPRGSLFGLIGPNGAGKTTAFSIACGFLSPDAGQVSILGTGGFDPHRLKGRVTALPQDAVLGAETRCIEHLEYYGRLQGLPRAEARRQGERLLEEVGLGDRRRSKARTLSHGMLRRLTVAQAMLGQPELILLDEPTSGLDPRHAHELRDLLRRTHRDGRTLVISSHNLPELEALCDHVAFIDRGIALASGPTDSLTGKGQEIEIDIAPNITQVASAASGSTKGESGASETTEGASGASGEAEMGRVVGEALGEGTVSWDEGRRVLRVVFEPREGRQAEDVIGVVLRVLLARGVRIAGVRRGTSLEKKFLEMT